MRRLTIGFVTLLVLLAAGQTRGSTWNVIQLTNDGAWGKYYLDVADTGVVWTHNNDVYLYDGSTTTNLSSGHNQSSMYPTIAGNHVAWGGSDASWNYGLYLYDGTGVSLVVDDATTPLKWTGGFGITDSAVAYSASDSTNTDVHLDDGTSTVNLSDGYSQINIEVAMAGDNVAWTGYTSTWGYGLYCHDGTGVRLVAEVPTSNLLESFDVSDSAVAYKLGFDVYLDDGTTAANLSEAYAKYSYDPCIAEQGDNVAWVGYDASWNNRSLYFFDGTDVSVAVADVPGVQFFNTFDVADSGIVYTAGGAEQDVYFYDGTTSTNLSAGYSHGNTIPCIAGDYVAWIGLVGNHPEVFLATRNNAVVPEPGTLAIWGLLSLCGVGFTWHRKRRAA